MAVSEHQYFYLESKHIKYNEQVADMYSVNLHCDECGEEYPPMKVVLNMNLTILDEEE